MASYTSTYIMIPRNSPPPHTAPGNRAGADVGRVRVVLGPRRPGVQEGGRFNNRCGHGNASRRQVE